MRSDAGQRAPGAGHLCHPVPMAAALVLAVNDHLLKGAGILPPVVAGKLSDVAGLFFFPVLCEALVRALRRLAGRDRGETGAVALGSIAVTGAAFTAIKLSPSCNALVGQLWGENALDPTDLLALPALGLAWLWLRRARPRPVGRRLQVAALAAAGLASVATSAPRVQRVYPRWVADEPARRRLPCAEAELWVAKSGKEGAGVTLELRADRSRCAVELQAAELRLPSRSIRAAALPRRVELRPGAAEHVWLAFPFDGDAAWNSGERRADLRLTFAASVEPITWEVALTNAIEGGSQIGVARRGREPEDAR